MATSYSTLLGLALPVQGELSGTWGDTVNNYITNYLDSAIAGAVTLSTDADVTLTKTTGSALGATSSQYAIILCTGARTVLRTITAPAASKIYSIVNTTSGGFGVKIVGAGPTTGVTIANGVRAIVAWNGSDFTILSQVDASGNALAAATATTATNATNTGITDDAATASAVYPTWVTANTGNLPQKTTSAKLTFVPSTGVLSATSFTGAGTGLTGTASSLTSGKATNIAGGAGGQIHYQSAADTTSLLANGTAGQYLQSNGGTAAPSWSTPSGGFTTVAISTASGTFTIPAGVTKMKVTVVGGGGSGSAGSVACGTTAFGGGGGGSGGAGISYLTGLTPGNTLSVTVSGAGASTSLASGTQTITTITATGGSAGAAQCSGGAGGSCSGATINLGGQAGGTGSYYPNAANGWGGNGGSSILGGGGAGGNGTSSAGTAYGAGGGGGSHAAGGSAGVAGCVIFEY